MTVPEPNGLCWDGCGEATSPGSFFLAGHDKRAQAYLAVIRERRTIADELFKEGLVPGQRDIRAETLMRDPEYQQCGLKRPDGKACLVIGKGIGMRQHRANTKAHLQK
jgi:hypothetical protein